MDIIDSSLFKFVAPKDHILYGHFYRGTTSMMAAQKVGALFLRGLEVNKEYVFSIEHCDEKIIYTFKCQRVKLNPPREYQAGGLIYTVKYQNYVTEMSAL